MSRRAPRLSTSRAAEAISLAAGQRVKDLEIRLTPAASITGTVVDRRNRSVAKATVGIVETRRKGGTLRIVMLGDSIVNDTMRSGWVGQRLRASSLRAIRARRVWGCG